MACATVSEAAPQPGRHGPIGSAVKWAFKNYLRARQVVDEAVAEARDEISAAAQPTAHIPEPMPVAGGSDVEVRSRRRISAHGEPLAAPPRRTDERPTVRLLTAAGAEEHPASELRALLARDDGFVWVDIPTFDAPAERMLTQAFEFHPLAIRDCREPGQMPKVHVYRDHMFIVLHAPERLPTGEIGHRELDQFIGPRYLVTVHERLKEVPLGAQLLETSTVFDRIEAGRAHPTSSAELSYAIVTRLVARMEELVSELAAKASELGRRVVERRQGAPEAIVDEMYELRHALLAVETIADQNYVVYSRAAALSARQMPAEYAHIEDLVDQFARVRGLCQGQRELLQGALDFARTRATAKMDRAMSRMALLSAIALPMTVISSIAGMNIIVFNQTNIVLLTLALGSMALLTWAMLRWTQHQGWI